jgi:hypothetical protein
MDKVSKWKVTVFIFSIFYSSSTNQTPQIFTGTISNFCTVNTLLFIPHKLLQVPCRGITVFFSCFLKKTKRDYISMLNFTRDLNTRLIWYWTGPKLYGHGHLNFGQINYPNYQQNYSDGHYLLQPFDYQFRNQIVGPFLAGVLSEQL